MRTIERIVKSLRYQLATPLGSRPAISVDDQIAWWQDNGRFNMELYKRVLIAKSESYE